MAVNINIPIIYSYRAKILDIEQTRNLHLSQLCVHNMLQSQYTVWVQIFDGSIFRGFEKSSLILNFRGYKFSWQ